MACYKPLLASRRMQSNGKNLIRFKYDPHPDAEPVRLPCGQCTGCRLERAKTWAVRCLHEASLHDYNSFITLTYNDDNLPIDESLNHHQVQKFFKKLRKAGIRFRYYMCGEYGENYTKRPHYHIIMFGYRPNDLQAYGTNKQGQTLYTSPKLTKLWSYGNTDVGEVTYESASYVARYIMKKQLGKEADYTHLTQHGLITERKPEYTAMSRKPGIAKDWFDQYLTDIFPHDELQILTKKGVQYAKIPRYYDQLMETMAPGVMDTIKKKRQTQAYEKFDFTDLRMKAREKITEQKLHKLKREL